MEQARWHRTLGRRGPPAARRRARRGFSGWPARHSSAICGRFRTCCTRLLRNGADREAGAHSPRAVWTLSRGTLLVLLAGALASPCESHKGALTAGWHKNHSGLGADAPSWHMSMRLSLCSRGLLPNCTAAESRTPTTVGGSSLTAPPLGVAARRPHDFCASTGRHMSLHFSSVCCVRTTVTRAVTHVCMCTDAAAAWFVEADCSLHHR